VRKTLIVDAPNPVWPNSTVVGDPADAATVVAAIIANAEKISAPVVAKH
jgi:hypothetical protein